MRRWVRTARRRRRLGRTIRSRRRGARRRDRGEGWQLLKLTGGLAREAASGNSGTLLDPRRGARILARMEICIYRAYEEMSRAAAAEVADVLNAKPNAVLGMATGSTPLGVYQELVKLHRRGGVGFSHVTTFNLPEDVGLPLTPPPSYPPFMHRKLFPPINNPPRNTPTP